MPDLSKNLKSTPLTINSDEFDPPLTQGQAQQVQAFINEGVAQWMEQAANMLDPNEPAPDLDPEGHFGVEGEVWVDALTGLKPGVEYDIVSARGIRTDGPENDWPMHHFDGEDAEVLTQAEEPIEERLHRAWLNGFREGSERTARMGRRWDHS